MKKYLLLFFILNTYFNLCGQNSSDTSEINIPKWSIGISPSAFFNVFSAVQLSVDRRIYKTINFTVETGGIFAGIYPDSKTCGIRIRTGFQHIIPISKNSSFSEEILILYRYISENHFYREYYSGERYYEIMEFKRERILTGALLNLGIINMYSGKYIFEVGCGAGLGKLIVKDSDKADRPFGNLFFPYSGTGKYIFN